MRIFAGCVGRVLEQLRYAVECTARSFVANARSLDLVESAGGIRFMEQRRMPGGVFDFPTGRAARAPL